MEKSVFAIIFLSFFSRLVFAETIVEGVITENSWWTPDKSPYVITNDLIIAQNAKLIIEPGVEVLIERPVKMPVGIEQIDHLDSFSVAIKVFGVIYAVGTPQNPIIFKGKDVEETYTHWYGIVISSRRTQEISIGFATVSSAANGICVKNGGMPVIRNTLFEFNNVGLRIEGRSSVRVLHCVFSQNYLAGLRVLDSNPYIYNSIITNNNIVGLWGDKNTEIEFKNNLCWGNGNKDYSDTDPNFGIMKKLNSNGDSVDIAGNLRCDPVFAGSVKESELQKKGAKEKIPYSTKIIDQIEDKRYFLSPYSPCIDAGTPDKMFRENDGSLPDLGIFGGAEVIRF